MQNKEGENTKGSQRDKNGRREWKGTDPPRGGLRKRERVNLTSVMELWAGKKERRGGEEENGTGRRRRRDNQRK